MKYNKENKGVDRTHPKKNGDQKLSYLKSFFSSQDEAGQAGTSVMIVPTNLEANNLNLAFAAYYSNMLFRNVVSANSQFELDIREGMSFLSTIMFEMTKGAGSTLDRIPLIFDIILTLCKERSVPLGGGEVRYTPVWTEANFFRLRNAFLLPNGSVYVFGSAGSNPISLYDFNILVGTSAKMARFLRCTSELSSSSSYGGLIVHPGLLTGSITFDPSVFARLTPYTLSTLEIGGFYNLCECETRFGFPMFSKFNNPLVGNSGNRSPARFYHPQSGTIATPVGLSLTTDMSYTMYANTIPVIHKFIDFYQFYEMVVGWVFAEMNNYLVPGNTLFTTPMQFTFSSSDFAFMLRQCVLTLFPEQCHTQFVTPTQGFPSVTNSVFSPFIVDTITTPNPSASGLLLPEFIVQNLNMLRQVVIKAPQSDPLVQDFISWMPVWGVYSGDTVPTFNFLEPIIGLTPIFSPVSIIPPGNLWDASLAIPSDSKANINLFVADIKNEFNLWVSGYAKPRSTPISPLVCSPNNPTSLLPYTRVLQTVLPNFTINPNAYSSPIYKYITGIPSPKTGTKVKDILPASYSTLKTVEILSISPFGLDVVGALDYFVIPSIRFDNIGPSFLTKSTYQVITGEACDYSYVSGTSISSAYEVSRITTSASIFQSGFAPGSSTNDTLTAAVATLVNHDSAINFASSLFGVGSEYHSRTCED